MATLDENAKSLIDKSYPQAKDADSDPVKLSSTIFSNTEVSHETATSRGHLANTHPVLDRREDRDRTMADHRSPHRLLL